MTRRVVQQRFTFSKSVSGNPAHLKQLSLMHVQSLAQYVPLQREGISVPWQPLPSCLVLLLWMQACNDVLAAQGQSPQAAQPDE